MSAPDLPVGRGRAWLLASRPATLPAAVVPVLVGTAAAVPRGVFSAAVFAAALAASLLIQVGTNFANDYFDYSQGADTEERTGPVRLIQSGLVGPGQVLLAALVSFGLAALIGLYLVYVGGWPILLIGMLSILAGLAYTGGPYPLGYHGLGDVFVFVFFGLVAVTGTYYLHTGEVDAVAWLASVPVGLLVTNILVVNNVRDINTDRVAGKHTLATRIGRPASEGQYALFLAVAYMVPVLLWLLGMMSVWFWLPWLTVPLAARALQGLRRLHGRALNTVLRQTGQLHLLYGLLFSLSLLLS